MGFDKKAIINAGIPGDSLSRTKIDFLNNELRKVTGIEEYKFQHVCTLRRMEDGTTDLRLPANHSNNPDMIVSMKAADTAFFPLYNLQLVAGQHIFSIRYDA